MLVTSLLFIHCFDTWLGDRKGLWSLVFKKFCTKNSDRSLKDHWGHWGPCPNLE